MLNQDSRTGGQRHPARHISSDRVAVLRGLPRLSARMAALLVTGDTSGRYTTGDDDADGWRITCAIATGASQPGHAWSEEQLWYALVLRPTEAGAWLRRLRSRKGDEAARAALRRAMVKARALVATSPALGSRADAAGELAEVRDLVESCQWPGQAAGTNLKVVTAHLRTAERAGGREYTLSMRQLAERAGCSLSTTQAAVDRLAGAWFSPVGVSGDADGSTIWRLHRPAEIRARLAGAADPQLGGPLLSDTIGTPPTPPTRQMAGVPNTSTRTLGALMAHDAMHHYGHGAAGARILATLDPTDGMSPQSLADALGYHVRTIRRRLAKLAADGLVTCTEGLYYRPGQLASEQLDHAANQRGTTGNAARRAWRYAQERARRRAYLEYLAARPRRDQTPDPLVPLEAYDPHTGELLPDHAHNWTGWDVTDPWRPIWRGHAA